MGGDGGSIPKRGDVVRTAGYRFARNLGGMGYLPNTQVRANSGKYNKSEERKLKWTRCALTEQKLRPPLVACRLGQLYNKEALIEQLLQRKTTPLPPSASRIESRKDVKDLVVDFDAQSGKLVCPILKIEFDSGVKGVFLWKCGCVISTKAIEELLPTTSEDGLLAATAAADDNSTATKAKPSIPQRQCPVCGTSYDPSSDVVQLIPDPEDLLAIKEGLLEMKQKSTSQRQNSRSQRRHQEIKRQHDSKDNDHTGTLPNKKQKL